MNDYTHLITEDMEKVSWDTWSDRVQEINTKYEKNCPHNFRMIEDTDSYVIYNDFNGNFFSLNVYSESDTLYYMKKNYVCP